MKHTLTSFSRTMRALDADGMSPALLGVILIAGLGGVWSSWLVVARVPVYQLSEAARLELESIHPVASPVAGRVVSSALALGREVRAGDVLLEVEAERERLETAEERMRLASVSDEIQELHHEISAEEQVIEQTRRASRAAVAEATERLSAAEAAAGLAIDKVNRLKQLETRGLISAIDLENARAEDQSRRGELAAARMGIDRLRAEQLAAERGRRGKIASLERERVGLQGLRAATVSTVARRESEAERRRIRAAVSGRLGEVNPVQIGAVIREGDRLASIIPQGQVRAVAEFGAPALGRLRRGQIARLRLDGFPWTQYGYVDAEVTSVASETREQRVRVELAVRRPASSAIPMQHGMPGAVEVEVERVAPIALLIRALGHGLSGSQASPSAPPAATRSSQ